MASVTRSCFWGAVPMVSLRAPSGVGNNRVVWTDAALSGTGRRTYTGTAANDVPFDLSP